jgi:DNA polymerase III delta prime subunit
MKEKKHTIWVEKYRPTTLEEMVWDENIKNIFQEFINSQNIPHLGLFGPPGSGKSTLAKILVNNIECDFLYINAADERGMDVIREKIGGFASTNSFKPLKIVILDESTHILQASQVVLLNMIETYSLKTRFILTGNYPERLIEPLRSRLQEFKFESPSKKTVALHVKNILEKENIKYDIEDIATIIYNSYPDIRKIINNIQANSYNNELKIININNKNDITNEILKELSNINKNSFNNIRQIINNNIGDINNIYRLLYENLNKFSKGNDGLICVILNEHIYQNNFLIDKEINLMSAINKIIEIIK